MTRIVQRPIEVIEQAESGTPRTFLDNKTYHRVLHVLDQWKESGKWWGGEKQRDMYKVLTDHGVYEIEYQDGQWQSYRILD